MISILYLNQTVMCAGTVGSRFIEEVPGIQTECQQIDNIDEPDYRNGDLTMNDGTIVHNGDEYLNYLKKYIPV